jgi:hypothetical protein
VLHCFHVLCSQCLAEHIHAYPEEGVAAVTCPFCAEVTIKDLPPGCTVSAITTSEDPDAHQTEPDMTVSRISSYDSDISISNVDTTPVQYNTNHVDLSHDDGYTLEMDMVYSHLPDDILNCYDDSDGEGPPQQHAREDAVAPSLEEIYRHDDSINDSAEIELEQERSSPLPASVTAAAGRGASPRTPSSSFRSSDISSSVRHKMSSSTVDARGSTVETERPSEAAWLHITLNLAVVAYAALVAVAGPGILGNNGYLQVHTTLTVRRGLGALLVLHYLMHESTQSTQGSAEGRTMRTSSVTQYAACTDAAAVIALLALNSQASIQKGCTLMLQHLGEALTRVDPVYRICIIAVGAALMSTGLVVAAVYVYASAQPDAAESEEDSEVSDEHSPVPVENAVDMGNDPRAVRTPRAAELPVPQSRPAVPKSPSPERRRRRYAGVNPMKHRGKHGALGRGVKAPVASGAQAEAEHRPAPQTAPVTRPALGSLAERISRSAGDSRGRSRDTDGEAVRSGGPPTPALLTPTKPLVPINSTDSSAVDELPIDAVSAHLAALLLLRHAAQTAPVAQSQPPTLVVSPPHASGDAAQHRTDNAGAALSPPSYTRRIFEGGKFSYPSSPTLSPSPKRLPVALSEGANERNMSPQKSPLPGTFFHDFPPPSFRPLPFSCLYQGWRGMERTGALTAPIPQAVPPPRCSAWPPARSTAAPASLRARVRPRRSFTRPCRASRSTRSYTHCLRQSHHRACLRKVSCREGPTRHHCAWMVRRAG